MSLKKRCKATTYNYKNTIFIELKKFNEIKYIKVILIIVGSVALQRFFRDIFYTV